MEKSKIKTILIVLIAIAVAIGGYQVYQRYAIESKDKSVDLTVEWVQFKDFAKKSGVNEKDALAMAGDNVTAFIFKEQLFTDLQTDGSVMMENPMALSMDVANGDTDIYNDVGQKITSDKINLKASYYIISNKNIAQRITRNLTNKRIADYHLYNVRAGKELYPLLEVNASPNSLSQVGVGFDEQAMSRLSKMGYDIFPQIRSWQGYQKGDLEKVLQPIKDYNIGAVLFNDLNLPGVELEGDELKDVFLDMGNTLQKYSLPVATIEFFDQKGLESLIKANDRNIIRSHVVADNEMATMNKDKALDRYSLAVRERNIRVLYVKLFQQMDFDDNMTFVSQVKDNIVGSGFTLDTPSSMPDVPYNNVLTIILALGIVSAGIYLLSLLGYNKMGYIIAALALLCTVGLIIIGKGVLATKLLALLSSIVFPTLGITLFMNKVPQSIGKSLVTFIKITAVTICGGLIIAALLGDKSFMYAIDTFTGVKLSQIGPLLLVFIIFVFYRNEQMNPIARFKSVFDEPVKFGYLAIIGVLAIVMMVFMLRTGNDGMSVSSLELAFRTKLDQLLLVRPRTKEFLLGVPALLIAIRLGYKDKYLPLLLLGAIGQVSMSNTFCHLHTPILVSLLRTLNGIWLGLVLGIICILIGGAIYKAIIKHVQNSGDNI